MTTCRQFTLMDNARFDELRLDWMFRDVRRTFVAVLILSLIATTLLWSTLRGDRMHPKRVVGGLTSSQCGVQSQVIDEFSRRKPKRLMGNASGRYVSLYPGVLFARRAGNQLFSLAALMHVARVTGRLVALIRNRDWLLNRIFDIDIPIVNDVHRDLCPCVTLVESAAMAYEHAWLDELPNRTGIADKNLLLFGYTQSWLYTVGVEQQLRERLRPKAHLTAAVCRYFEDIRPGRWSNIDDYVRVGIHIRAGDIRSAVGLDFGFTIPQLPYFERAIEHIVNNDVGGARKTTRAPMSRQIQLIVASDDVDWCRSAINLTSAIDIFQKSSDIDFDLVYSVNKSDAFDLVMLSKCDAVVMTTGTYGWWAAWLAGRPTTIYYENWPRHSSHMSAGFNRAEFFPPHWIPIGGPYFSF